MHLINNFNLSRVPNVNHSISGHQDSVLSFYLSVSGCKSKSFLFDFASIEKFFKQQILPSWTWTRTINETHGQIRANISISDGHPAPENVTVYQARTVFWNSVC